jgi:hypothetical protein
MFSVGSYCVRYAKVRIGALLPLERIELVEGDFYLVCNRYGSSSNTNKRNVIELENSHSKQLWDELIQLELRIKFLQECLESPEKFGYIQSIGFVRKIEQAEKEFSPENTPWTKVSIGETQLAILPESRLVQVEYKLTNLEFEHDFLMQAIESLD